MCEWEYDDVNNNLFAPSGGLGKYDKLFNTKSLDIQKTEYYRSKNSKSSDKNWAGFVMTHLFYLVYIHILKNLFMFFTKIKMYYLNQEI